MFQPDTKPIHDRLLLIEPGADHKRKSEPAPVSVVELFEAGNLLRREVVQPGAGLLFGGGRRQRPRYGGGAHQVRMGADECKLPLLACRVDGFAQRAMQMVHAGEGPLWPGRFSNPGRVLEYRADDADEVLTAEAVDFSEGVFRSFCAPHTSSTFSNRVRFLAL